MHNVLTVQALSAAKQQEFTPFGDTRPSYDYVKRGDVIRVAFDWYNTLPASVSAEIQFRQRLGQRFTVINLSSSRGWTFNGNVVVDVQARSDYSRLSDVLSVVLHEAQAAGLGVDTAGARAEFVSRVEDTGGNVASSITLPQQGSNPLSDFVGNLTSSPISLAVIVGGAVLVMIALRR